MENKTTIELFNLLDGFRKKQDDNKFDWDKYGEVIAELRKREPFSDLFGQKEDTNDFTFEERIERLEEDLKLLKRHKHDEHTGDVLVRI